MAKKTAQQFGKFTKNGVLKELTIVRSLWSRGATSSSLLLDANGKRCCIGFLCTALEFSDRRILNHSVVLDLAEDLTEAEKLMEMRIVGKYVDGKLYTIDWINGAYGINDASGIDDEERESKLKKLFEDHGVELVFVD